MGFGAGPVLVPCVPAKANRIMSLFHVKLDPPKPHIPEIRSSWSQIINEPTTLPNVGVTG